MIPVRRGNGSWESGGGPGRSVPMKITGRAGFTRITLMPAPTGKGLVIGETGRMILEMVALLTFGLVVKVKQEHNTISQIYLQCTQASKSC